MYSPSSGSIIQLYFLVYNIFRLITTIYLHVVFNLPQAYGFFPIFLVILKKYIIIIISRLNLTNLVLTSRRTGYI